VPHPVLGEGHTRWRERGWESPNSDEGTYTVVLFIYVLCAPVSIFHPQLNFKNKTTSGLLKAKLLETAIIGSILLLLTSLFDVVAHDAPVASTIDVALQLAMLLLPLTFLGFLPLLWSLAVVGIPAVVNIPTTGVFISSRAFL
jgi:hypothetical protein